MPQLRRLEIGFLRPELVATLLGSKLGAQLTALVVGIGHADAGEVEALVTAVKRLRGLALTSLELVPAKGAARSFTIRGKTWTPTAARR